MNFLLHGSTITYYIEVRVPTSRFPFVNIHQDLYIEIVVGLNEVLNEKCTWLLSVNITIRADDLKSNAK